MNNGYCHDHVNNAECNYDGGDCCGPNVNKKNCADCICYSQNCDGPLELISDGFCNDETNNANCNFDGGDCCGDCTNTNHCLNCVCYADSPIDPYCKWTFSIYSKLPNLFITTLIKLIKQFCLFCIFVTELKLLIKNNIFCHLFVFENFGKDLLNQWPLYRWATEVGLTSFWEYFLYLRIQDSPGLGTFFIIKDDF